jgi:hypothetical protein
VVAVAAAIAVAAFWWQGTREAEREVEAQLVSARERLAGLESLALDGRSLEKPWGALRACGISELGWDDAHRHVRDLIKSMGVKAGVRIAKLDVRAADEPAPNPMGCVMEIRARVEGTSADLVNWVYLLESSDKPVLWIESVTWISAGSPQRLKGEAVIHTAYISPAERT